MTTIGRTLAALREQYGYSVAGLSARTCIREQVLEGIEADDFSPCGGDFYARGHIRALSAEFGIDAQPLIEMFDTEHADAPAAPATPDELFTGSTPTGVERPERRRWPIVVAAAITGAGILAAAQAWPTGDEPQERAATRTVAERVSEPRADAQREPRNEAAKKEAGPRQGAKAVPPDAADAEKKKRAHERAEREKAERAKAAGGPDAVALTLSSDERSWVSVVGADGENLYAGFLLPGASQDVKGKGELRLNLGKPDSVRMKVNGKDHGAAGQQSQLTVRPDGPVS